MELRERMEGEKGGRCVALLVGKEEGCLGGVGESKGVLVGGQEHVTIPRNQSGRGRSQTWREPQLGDTGREEGQRWCLPSGKPEGQIPRKDNNNKDVCFVFWKKKKEKKKRVRMYT